MTGFLFCLFAVLLIFAAVTASVAALIVGLTGMAVIGIVEGVHRT